MTPAGASTATRAAVRTAGAEKVAGLRDRYRLSPPDLISDEKGLKDMEEKS